MESIDNKKDSVERRGKGRKRVLKTAAAVALLWAALLIALQIALSPAVLTGIVEKFAAEYIEADIDFESISLSMFRNFPDIRLEMDNCSLTYPHDKFEGAIDSGIRLQQLGRGDKDTLAVFQRLTLRANPFSLIAWKLKIREIQLTGPRIFANTYSDGRSNWEIFPEEGEEEEDADEGDFSLPRLQFGKVVMDGYPTVSYTSAPECTGVMLRMKAAGFSGRLDKDFAEKKNVELTVDSLFAAGRIGPDTLLAGIDRFRLAGGRNRMLKMELDAKAFVGTDELGRLTVPVTMRGEVQVMKDSIPALDIRELKGNLAWIPFELKGQVKSLADSLEMDLGLDVRNLEPGLLIRNYGAQLISEDVLKLRTDAVFEASVRAKGSYVYADGKLPSVSGGFHIPESSFALDGTDLEGKMALDGVLDTDLKGRINVDLKKLSLNAGEQAYVNGRLRLEDLLGSDPVLVPDIRLNVNLGQLGRYMPEDFKMELKGSLDAGVKGRARLSQLDLYKLPNTSLSGYLKSDTLYVSMPSDSINLYARGLDFGLETRRDTVNSYQSIRSRMLEIQAGIDTVSLQYGPSLLFRGKTMQLSMQNDASILKALDTVTFWPMKGAFSARRMSLRDSDSTSVALSSTSNTFSIRHLNGDEEVPLISLSSRNRSIRLKSSSGRVFARNLNVGFGAQMRTKERTQKMKRRLDSLALVYPGVPRDSLIKVAYRNNKSKRPVEDWMKEKDFEKHDLNLKLGGELRKYFTQWNLNGQIEAERVKIVTPLLPLDNIVSGVDASFSNDRIDLKGFKFSSGSSEFDFTGSISGMRRALLGRGRLKVDAKLVADQLNCNELLSAYAAGRSLDVSKVEDMDDEEYEAAMKAAEDTTEAGDPLIVVPSNVEADLAIEGYDVEYANMFIDWLTCNVRMKERCVQVYNTMAAANLGNLFFEGYYATPDKENIRTGFNFSLVDVTAAEVFGMVPQIKELVPMLSSFEGLLDCDLAGTARLDTAMNVVMPSVKGIMRIGGKNLSLAQDKDLRKITRLLHFRNKKELKIDKMTVEGQIADGRLEIFPFDLNIDRYEIAMSGVQNMDMSFRYSISVLKSPLVFKFGVDLYGSDFDNWKFKIGKAKYKNARSIPAFSATIDQEKVNLSYAIRNIFEKGVNDAVEVSGGEAIRRKKEQMGYVAAVDMETQALSGEEQLQMEENAARMEADGDSIEEEAEGGKGPTVLEIVSKAYLGAGDGN